MAVEIPEGLRYAETHEWARLEGGEVTVGITAYATEKLGDLTFLELPEVGAEVRRGEPFGEVESVKTVSDLFAPVSGEIVAVNAAAVDDPELVTRSPYGEGWLVRIRPADPSETGGLLEAEAYAARLED